MKIYRVLMTALFAAGIFMQGKAQMHALQIGDTVPDKLFTNLTNYPGKPPSIRTFRGKVLILDFWSTYCEGCIESMPKMEALQAQFPGKLQIFLINASEPEHAILSRIKTMKSYRPGTGLSTLPTVNGDSTWQQLFPHFYVPHHVWIDSSGKVVAITNDYNATPQHVQQILDGNTVHFEIKENLELRGYHIREQGLLASADTVVKPLYYSCISEYIPGAGGTMSRRIDSTYGLSTIIFTNSSVLQLFQEAFLTGKFRWGVRTIIEVKNRDLITDPADPNRRDAWNAQNSFCYQVNVPVSYEEKIPAFMQQDLNRFFGVERGIQAQIEQRRIPCLVIRQTTPGLLKVATSQASAGYSVKNGKHQWTHFLLDNIIYRLTQEWEDMSKPLVVLNESPSRNTNDLIVDLTIDTPDLKNIATVRKSLQRYGLDVVREVRELPVLVIRDQPQ